VTPSPPKVSAIVVNYESGEDLPACLESLRGQPEVLETIVVDNGSTDGSAAEAVNFPATSVLAPGENLGFAGGANAGSDRARGEYLLFLNPDVRLAPGAVGLLAAALERHAAAVAGPRIELERSHHAEFGCTIDPLGSPRATAAGAKPLYVPGCALMTTARAFQALGGFDERFFLFAEDADYCWRALLAGHDVTIAPGAIAWHRGGGSAPGGYVTDHGLATTRLRMGLRERNTLAMLLKCYGRTALVVFGPLALLQTLLTSLALLALRRPRTAGDVLAGLWWNMRQLPRTLALRRAVQATRRRSDRAILGRMYRGWHKAAIVLRSGLPVVDERS
jgi:N-acetylglucosaminyl-diphospho-decaprenol L-rhamnosyltransferase